jgi:hypothetical protein
MSFEAMHKHNVSDYWNTVGRAVDLGDINWIDRREPVL